ncbi:hypothetical protein SE15_01275 [Thermanaerothrix daxensis]|uniref:Uncharacterized protein n=1 Tax=Thermanaerothrix daxensis TaxID=869279 RepID=A0A0P6XWS8_9CHLR|nr:hypothetical protein [Thermanaerothrix daxensis]KPL83889.1 hypothetical protein SE15_01275 [Thermanaerothrix daxensis]
MKKPIFWLFLVLTMAVWMLSACTGGNTTANAANGRVAASQGTPQLFNFANQSPESKLAIGILKMEETSLAITSEQAKALLPLWKAVKTLSTSTTASAEELSALYRQIEETLTADQRKYIEELQMTGTDLQDMMQSLGIQDSFGERNGSGQNLSESERATRIAQFQAQRSAEGVPAGGPGMAPGGGPGGEPGFAPPVEDTTTQRTPDPTQMAVRRNLGLSRLFLDPLIQMLEKKAAQ